jgi:hypothetical protein
MLASKKKFLEDYGLDSEATSFLIIATTGDDPRLEESEDSFFEDATHTSYLTATIVVKSST